MAAAKEQGKKKESEKQRGTQDELEIMAMIIRENKWLNTVVLERLRSTKERLGQGKSRAPRPDAMDE